MSNQAVASAIFSSLLDTKVLFDSDANNNNSSVSAANKPIDSCAIVFDEIYKKHGMNMEKKLEVFDKIARIQNMIVGRKQLFVKTLTGSTITLPFDEKFLVEDVKKMIEDYEGVPAEEQRIIFAGQQLENDRTLADYKMKQDSTIHLVLRMRGGGCSLHVNTYDGKHLSLDGRTNMTVREMKELIEEKTKISTERQILIYKSKELTNGYQTVESIGMKPSGDESDMTVYMVLNETNSPPKILSNNILDPRYDYDFTNITDLNQTFMRGGKVYKRPCGWKRIALKVKDKYNENIWLGSSNTSGEWPVAYHGTNFDGIHGISFKGFDMSKWKRELYGKAHYTTPFIEIAEQYACHAYLGGQTIKFVLQCRVNSDRMLVRKDGKYWLLPNDQDLRPYGICFKIICWIN